MDRPELHCGAKTQFLLGRLTHVKERPPGPHGLRRWTAYCPVHENDGARHKPSLAVQEGDRWINLVCHQCNYWDIVAALGLKSEDVALRDDGPYDPNGPKPKRPPVDRRQVELEAKFAAQLLQREPQILARLRSERGWAAGALEKLGVGWLTLDKRLSIPVYDKDGKLHDVVRYDPFRQFKRKTLAGEGKSRTIWPAPELMPRNGALHVVEGEGTAISMASIGLTAVSLPGGMPEARNNLERPGRFQGAGWHPSWAKRLLTHRQLIFWPDCDGDGRRLMTVASTDCEKAGARVTVIDLGGPDKFDIGDMLRYTNSLELRQEARAIIEILVASSESRRADQLVQAREWWKGWYGKFNGNAAA